MDVGGYKVGRGRSLTFNVVVVEGSRVRKSETDLMWWSKNQKGGRTSTVQHLEEPEVLVYLFKGII